MKRGQFNFWWIIIGAVLVLVVAVILISIFSSKIAIFQTQTESCSFKGGVCKPACTISEESLGRLDCPDDKPVCCLGLGFEK